MMNFTVRLTFAMFAYTIRATKPTGEPAMSDLQAQFDQAATDAKQLLKRPDNTTLLKLYSLYKQATVGDVLGGRPGGFDLEGKLKYDAWAKQKGKAKEAAMQEYIALVESLKKN
jgi:diazepam-binding inhibitor (GABA receptor modulating acyl-CoA-binding protein)